MNLLQILFRQLRNIMFCLIFSSRMWLPCIRRSLCWKLFLGFFIDILQCQLHVLLYDFFSQDKEKKRVALNDRTRVPCFACFACFAFFLMFPLSFQELKEMGKELDKLKKVSFCLGVYDHSTKFLYWELYVARRRKTSLH